MRMLILAATLGSVVALLAGPRPAASDQVTSAIAPITKLKLKSAPFDACMDSCFDIAERERAEIGPEPAAPRYRMSKTQSATDRAIFVRRLAAQMNMPEGDLNQIVPGWDASVAEWRNEDPQGDYRPDDLADVLAKYWLFAWMFGAGVSPNEITEAQREAVRLQMHRLFQTDGVLALLTEGQRQGLAEALIRGQYGDMLALSTADRDLGSVMESITQHFQSLFDIDLRKLGLSVNYGFVFRLTS